MRFIISFRVCGKREGWFCMGKLGLPTAVVVCMREDVVEKPFSLFDTLLRLTLKSFLTIVCRLLTGSLNNPSSCYSPKG